MRSESICPVPVSSAANNFSFLMDPGETGLAGLKSDYLPLDAFCLNPTVLARVSSIIYPGVEATKIDDSSPNKGHSLADLVTPIGPIGRQSFSITIRLVTTLHVSGGAGHNSNIPGCALRDRAYYLHQTEPNIAQKPKAHLPSIPHAAPFIPKTLVSCIPLDQAPQRCLIPQDSIHSDGKGCPDTCRYPRDERYWLARTRQFVAVGEAEDSGWVVVSTEIFDVKWEGLKEREEVRK